MNCYLWMNLIFAYLFVGSVRFPEENCELYLNDKVLFVHNFPESGITGGEVGEEDFWHADLQTGPYSSPGDREDGDNNDGCDGRGARPVGKESGVWNTGSSRAAAGGTPGHNGG
ncbi:uncharacterized protein LOC144603694 [Rhinoraja longicauda]